MTTAIRHKPLCTSKAGLVDDLSDNDRTMMMITMMIRTSWGLLLCEERIAAFVSSLFFI